MATLSAMGTYAVTAVTTHSDQRRDRSCLACKGRITPGFKHHCRHSSIPVVQRSDLRDARVEARAELRR